MKQMLKSPLLQTIFPLGLCLSMIVPALSSLAATTPSLGSAANYAVLASTFTNTTAGTTITGGIGFTTGPAVAPAGIHQNYGSGTPYAQAGTDQNTALSTLSSMPCTFTFPAGAVNLATETTHGAVGIYTPGVYCSTGAMNIGGPVTLSGNGTFVFRINGALTSTAGAIVSLNGASACNAFFTPTQATTLAANTTFAGTVIDDAGITIGANTTWIGMALAFGGTITTDAVTIAICSLPVVQSSASSSSLSSSVPVSSSSSLSSSVSSLSSLSSVSSQSSFSMSSSQSSSRSSFSSSSQSSTLSSLSSSSSSQSLIFAPVIATPPPPPQLPVLPQTGANFGAIVIAILCLALATSFFFGNRVIA